jgi:hypothetical protein
MDRTLPFTVVAALAFAALAPAGGVAHAAWPYDSAVNVPVATTDVYESEVRVVSDGADGALVLWMDPIDGYHNSTNMYARHLLGDGRSDPAWPSGGVPLCAQRSWRSSLMACSDGSGGAFAAWSYYAGGVTGWEAYLQHLRSDGSIDPAWPANGLLVGSGVEGQGVVAMMPDGDGGLFLALTDASSTVYRLLVQRRTSTGAVAPGWPAGNGLAVYAGGANQSDGGLVSDAAGGVFVPWSEERAANADYVFAHRVTAGGEI